MSDPVYGVCAGCGAVAWELLSGVSDFCLGCDWAAYNDDEDNDPCAHCHCESSADCVWRAGASSGGENE